jgi:hypothetical protein
VFLLFVRADSQLKLQATAICQGLVQKNVPLKLFGAKEGRKLAYYATITEEQEEEVKIRKKTEDDGVGSSNPQDANNCVIVAHPECVKGLEMPVVVVITADDVTDTVPRYVDPWFDVIACCTSQLVVVGKRENSLDFVRMFRDMHIRL